MHSAPGFGRSSSNHVRCARCATCCLKSTIINPIAVNTPFSHFSSNLQRTSSSLLEATPDVHHFMTGTCAQTRTVGAIALYQLSTKSRPSSCRSCRNVFGRPHSSRPGTRVFGAAATVHYLARQRQAGVRRYRASMVLSSLLSQLLLF